MSKRNKFAALTRRERVLLLQSLLMLPVTALSVKVLGVQRFRNALARLSRKGKDFSAHSSLNAEPAVFSKDLKIQEARQIARLVRAAANHGLYNANCLEQSLVLSALLESNGLENQIRFGARKEEDQLQAHAWVECLGIALNEDRGLQQRYAPFGGVTANTTVESR